MNSQSIVRETQKVLSLLGPDHRCGIVLSVESTKVVRGDLKEVKELKFYTKPETFNYIAHKVLSASQIVHARGVEMVYVNGHCFTNYWPGDDNVVEFGTKKKIPVLVLENLETK